MQQIKHTEIAAVTHKYLQNGQKNLESVNLEYKQTQGYFGHEKVTGLIKPACRNYTHQSSRSKIIQ
jgi:hypothetical protein